MVLGFSYANLLEYVAEVLNRSKLMFNPADADIYYGGTYSIEGLGGARSDQWWRARQRPRGMDAVSSCRYPGRQVSGEMK